jgi:hypothetical protein
MMSQRQREPRKPVRVPVRLKDDAGWCDAQIVNVSERGLMAMCAEPPPRGSYVEIRRGGYVMVGHVAWTADDRFGARVRERIVLDDLLRPVVPGRTSQRPGAECEVRVRTPRAPTLEERAAASARFARAFDFAAVAIAASVMAVLATTVVTAVFSEPLVKVERVLSGN